MVVSDIKPKSVSPGKEKLLSSEILNIHNNNSGGTLSSQ